MVSTFFAIIAIFTFAAILIAINLKALLYICKPNEVLVLAGTTRKTATGHVGYRLIHGGRAIRLPLIERAHRIDLTNMIIEIKVQGAYSKGGIPLDVSGMANIKVASNEPTIFNAIERFLTQSRDDIKRVAKETLEGNLRGVLATLTPEEVNQDRVKFAQNLLHEADYDLSLLGLSLDTLKIQTVSDEKGYLNSLGRKESAKLLMKARIAEADNEALAKARKAENLKLKELTKSEARIGMAKADMNRRVAESVSKQKALESEERAEVATQIAKTEAAILVEKERVEQIRLQLHAEKINKAEALFTKQQALAKGAAAYITENGQALAASIEELGKVWADCGEDAYQIFLAQKMDDILPLISKGMGKLNITNLQVYAKDLISDDSSTVGKSVFYADHIKKLLGSEISSLVGKAKE